MNKFLTSSLALAAMVAGPAMAADMPLKAPPPIPVFSWTGCYIGIQGGYKTGWVRTTAHNTIIPANDGAPWTPDYNISGGLGGGEIGCNYQVGAWVWGVEIDGSAFAKEGQANNFNPPFTNGNNWISKTSERWNAMARGRIGYAQDKWLWYITGGATWVGLDIATFLIPNPVLTNIERTNRVGWVVGFGTEYAVAYGWSVKWETLYTDYGTFRAFDSVSFNCGVSNNCTNRDVRLTEWITRFGLNYKFDWYVGKAPVVARY
jgi:outer membrane immunogenic protein